MRHPGRCRICGDITDIRNINLYIFGSEGLDVCHECEMPIVNFVREVVHIAAKARVKAMKLIKQAQ